MNRTTGMIHSKISQRAIIAIILLVMCSGCVWSSTTAVVEQNNTRIELELDSAALPAEARSLVEIELPACLQDATDLEVAYVTRVIDGDSIEVLLDGVQEQVRYIGVNTPEYYSDERDAAITASDLNRQLVEGQYVLLVRDVSDRDKFERLLRYVFTARDFVNYRLVAEGAAEARNYPPDTICADYLFSAGNK